MKRLVIVVLAIAILALTISCKQDIHPEEKDEGYLRIVLPEKDVSKSLTNAQSASVTNIYYVFVWNSSGEVVSASCEASKATKGNMPQIVLLPNTYKVVVLACTDAIGTICGSGYAGGVVITRGDTTEVEIELNAISFELTPPTDRVFQNDTFDVHVSLDMNNEKLGATGNLYVGTPTPTEVITELKSSLVGDYSIKAPEEPAEVTYRFLLDGITLIDEWFKGGYNKPMNLRVGYVGRATEALYDAMFLFTVNVEDETAHLAAKVKWADDPK